MKPTRITIWIVSLLLVSILFASGFSEASSTIVSTQSATNIGRNNATLNGNLTSMGTSVSRPQFNGNIAVGRYGNNKAGWIATIPSGTTLMLFEVGRTAATCGALSTLQPKGQTASKLTSSFKADGLSLSATEIWYMKNPPIGELTIWGNWTGTCTSTDMHIIGGIALKNVDLTSTFSTIALKNDDGTPDSSLLASGNAEFSAPTSDQIQAIVLSQITSTGAGDMRFNNQVGIDQPWGFLVSGSGTTYCVSGGGNEGCVEGGITTLAGITTDTAGSQTFYWAGSAVLINGLETPLSSVTVYFQWGDTSGLGNSTPPVTKTSIGIFSKGISGLTSNTAYYFKAMANGTAIVNGTILSFVTLPPFQIPFLNMWVVFVFIAVLVITLMGAWWIKGKRGG